MRRTFALAAAVLTLVLAGSAWMAASDADEFTLTVPVSSAEHETIEGYFSLGDTATLMAKPGSPLQRFLIRQRGQKVKITITREEKPELSRLIRQP